MTSELGDRFWYYDYTINNEINENRLLQYRPEMEINWHLYSCNQRTQHQLEKNGIHKTEPDRKSTRLAEMEVSDLRWAD